MPSGNFYYGKSGFRYKRSSGAGGRRNFAIDLLNNQPHTIYNNYISGAGVGANSIATRRAKMIYATKCDTGKCGRFYQRLSIHPYKRYNTYLDTIEEITDTTK